jgi:hypothetical protein
VLATVIDAARTATDQPVAVHCCHRRPPIALCAEAGADIVSLDLMALDRTLADELGETWDAGTTMFLGLVPSVDPASPVTLLDVAQPALTMVDRLGFARSWLADRAVPTPTCGLAGATSAWAKRALSLTSDLAKGFLEPPESWVSRTD